MPCLRPPRSLPVWRPQSLSLLGLAAATAFVAGCRDANQEPTTPSQPASPVVASVGADTVGEWTPPFSWPDVAIHLALLPTGKVLSFGRAREPQLWDPATNQFTEKPIGSDVFCSGHAFLPDGRLLVAGGRYLQDVQGIKDVNIFNPFTEAWEPAPPMTYARWYPTTTVLSNGEVAVVAGTDENKVHVELPEVWSGTGWRVLTSAVMKMPTYPKLFLAPGGTVFYAGEGPRSRTLNVNGNGSWKWGARTVFNLERSAGGAVMYEYGKILIVGGNLTPTNTAEVIDLNAKPQAWRFTSPMQYARRQLNAVLLPDGKVLVLGGSSGAGNNNPVGAVLAAEMWDPATETWTTLADAATPRVYHSTALLMPDGRVLFAGSGGAGTATNFLSAEFFSPPYLFKGPRPTITNAPATVGYNSTASVETPDAASITKVSWIRLGSVTHTTDMNQRYIGMNFTRVTGAIKVKTNKGKAALPPGHYMMFLLNAAGVPSEAKIIQIN
jgi:galactose oxidase